MSKVIQNRGGIGMGAPYDIPGYEYDPVTDKFKDLATGTVFDKDGNAKLEDSKSVSITDNGTYEIKPSATYDAMKKVALSVEVQGTADLEDNKEATIDVSAYTDPVEVTPTQGKDGMKKITVSLSNMPEVETTKQATIDVSTYDPANKPVITPTAGKQSMGSVEVTLDNIPSGSLTFYAWSTGSVSEGWTLSATPQVGDTFYPCGYDTDSIRTDPQVVRVIASVGEGTINVDGSNYSRVNEGDITFPITPVPVP